MDLDQCGCIIMWVVKLKINQGEGFLHCFSNLFRLLLFFVESAGTCFDYE